MNNESNQPSVRTKLPYSVPQLRVYGDIVQLTLNADSKDAGNPDDTSKNPMKATRVPG